MLLSLGELSSVFAEAGFEKYRARQVFESVYSNKIFDPQKITSAPKKLRDFLSEKFSFSPALPVGDSHSRDDTKKRLFALSDGFFVECVLLEAPENDRSSPRKTLCLSTQVGCASKCAFCASALSGFKRNLTAGEIVSQALPFTNPENPKKFAFENIVVMGMGEPLANLDNLTAALEIFNSPEKFNFGARRITVSTCGLADKIEELSERPFPYRLAISLHGATDEVRSRIMPINKKFPIARLVDAARKFSSSHGRMITLEYILIDSVNDSAEQAKKLSEIASRLHAHVNLIPYNAVPSLEWRRSPARKIEEFAKILERRGTSFTLRREKGGDIDAACGQLALKRNVENFQAKKNSNNA